MTEPVATSAARRRPLPASILAGAYAAIGVVAVCVLTWWTVSAFISDGGGFWGPLMLVIAFTLGVVPALMIRLGLALWRGSRTAWFVNLGLLGLSFASSVLADPLTLFIVGVGLALSLVPSTRAFYAPTVTSVDTSADLPSE